MRKFTKIILTLLVMFALTFNVSTVLASEGVKVFFNDNKLNFEVEPEITNETTMIPMRTIFESLSYTIYWSDETKTITAINDNNTIQMSLGSNTAYVNNLQINLSVAPYTVNGHTLVPLRFIAESSGAVVNWKSETSVVEIYSAEHYNTKPSEKSIIDVEEAKRSVVTIYGDKLQGSGVILSSDGYIVTNFHVLEGTKKIAVMFSNGVTYTGKVTIVGYNTVRDIVVIKIDQTLLPHATIGDSYELSREDSVVLIGSPNGIPNTVSQGKVEYTGEFTIISDAKIDHGSSGGGMFNKTGELIGITSAYSESGDSIAIPINLVKELDKNSNISLFSWCSVKPELLPPEQVEFVLYKRKIYIGWSNVYSADSYKIYISSRETGYYEPLSSSDSNDSWYWGAPYSVTIPYMSDEPLFVKMSSVKDGKESSLGKAYELEISNK